MTPGQVRVEDYERAVAAKRWQQLDTFAKTQEICKHYTRFATLMQQLLRILEHGNCGPDQETLIKHALENVITDHNRSFGTPPAWNY